MAVADPLSRVPLSRVGKCVPAFLSAPVCSCRLLLLLCGALVLQASRFPAMALAQTTAKDKSTVQRRALVVADYSGYMDAQKSRESIALGLAESLRLAGYATDLLAAAGPESDWAAAHVARLRSRVANATLLHDARQTQGAGPQVRVVGLAQSPIQYSASQAVALAFEVYTFLVRRRTSYELALFLDYGGLAHYALSSLRQGHALRTTRMAVVATGARLYEASLYGGAAALATEEDVDKSVLEQLSLKHAPSVLVSRDATRLREWLRAATTIPQARLVDSMPFPRAPDEASLIRQANSSPLRLPAPIETWAKTRATELVFWGPLTLAHGLGLFCDAVQRLIVDDAKRKESGQPVRITLSSITLMGDAKTPVQGRVLYGDESAELGETYARERAQGWDEALADDVGVRVRLLTSPHQTSDAAALAYLRSPAAGGGRKMVVFPSAAGRGAERVSLAIAAKDIPVIVANVSELVGLLPAETTRDAQVFYPSSHALMEAMRSSMLAGAGDFVPGSSDKAIEDATLAWTEKFHATGQAAVEERSWEPAGVGVVITHHNRAALLKQALDALHLQDYPRDKTAVLVVDDRSTDPAAYELVDALAAGRGETPAPNFFVKPRWDALLLRRNAFLGRARNLGYQHLLANEISLFGKAGGMRYVVFADDDNYSASSMLRRLVQSAQLTRADAVVCVNDYLMDAERSPMELGLVAGTPPEQDSATGEHATTLLRTEEAALLDAGHARVGDNTPDRVEDVPKATTAKATAGEDDDNATAAVEEGELPPPLKWPKSLGARYVPIGPAGTSGVFRNAFGDANGMWRTDSLRRLGGWPEDEGLSVSDWELYARAHVLGLSVEAVPIPLYWYRTSAGSMARSKEVVTANQLRHRAWLLTSRALAASSLSSSSAPNINAAADDDDDKPLRSIGVPELPFIVSAMQERMAQLDAQAARWERVATDNLALLGSLRTLHCGPNGELAKKRGEGGLTYLKNGGFHAFIPDDDDVNPMAEYQADAWEGYGVGYRRNEDRRGLNVLVDTADGEKMVPSGALLVEPTNIGESAGAIQRAYVGQAAASPLLLAGWALASPALARDAATRADGGSSADFSLYADVLFQDGTHRWAFHIPINAVEAESRWRYVYGILDFGKPIHAVTVVCMLRWRPGWALFDDVTLTTMEDGICGVDPTDMASSLKEETL